ncbi:uncharacterized protein DUF3810 [Mucilaginibacter yixingensis]|uniref:Uncharacterized protein DUF3810 n=1 Tax=Mucilaginibacter yixingensis TaxID=1295612 RepID=A0A2T5J5F7_9SPHI|nr:DUF3810 domain-containing protein [Mucilaginibacter yixingensis]PTQ93213.1 uncharacterized protein DUF3810 [Mucilaginibacter yixingensis]
MQKRTGKGKMPRAAKTALILLAVILALVLLMQSPSLTEQLYSNGIYHLFCWVLRPLTCIFPFSLGDVFYVVLILYIMVGIVHFFRYLFTKRHAELRKLLLKGVVVFELAWLAFYCFWGMNYYRPAAAELLDLKDTSYRMEDVVKVTSLIIDSANACRAQLTPAELADKDNNFYNTSLVAVKNLSAISPKFQTILPRLKPSMISLIISYMGTSGYYNPFTSEAQINTLMPSFEKPFVACHELSHQTGWGREDEANFAGYLAGTQSNDKLLRYSSYYAGIEEFMRYLRLRDTIAHKVLVKRISPLVILDFKADSAHWAKYQGNASMVSGLFYDRFLKMNNQPHGLHTYNRMIRLTMAWYRRRYHIW